MCVVYIYFTFGRFNTNFWSLHSACAQFYVLLVYTLFVVFPHDTTCGKWWSEPFCGAAICSEINSLFICCIIYIVFVLLILLLLSSGECVLTRCSGGGFISLSRTSFACSISLDNVCARTHCGNQFIKNVKQFEFVRLVGARSMCFSLSLHRSLSVHLCEVMPINSDDQRGTIICRHNEFRCGALNLRSNEINYAI